MKCPSKSQCHSSQKYKTNPKNYMETQKTLNSKSSPEQKEK
jgi:hypothetical protein